MRIDVFLHRDLEVLAKLDTIVKMLSNVLLEGQKILQKEVIMGTELEDIKAQVEASTSVIGSAITLLQGLKAKLDVAIASGDMSQVVALRDQIAADDANLAAAVTANTPAA